MPFTGRVITASFLEHVPSVVLQCCRMNTRSQEILSSKDNHKEPDITLTVTLSRLKTWGFFVGNERLDCWKSRFFTLGLSRKWTFVGHRSVADKVAWLMVDFKLILWSSFFYCSVGLQSCRAYCMYKRLFGKHIWMLGGIHWRLIKWFGYVTSWLMKIFFFFRVSIAYLLWY